MNSNFIRKDILSIIPAQRIPIQVYGVNGTSQNLIYNARIYAYDFAILKLNPTKCLPKIQDHPHLKFGEGRKALSGIEVYILGNSVKK